MLAGAERAVKRALTAGRASGEHQAGSDVLSDGEATMTRAARALPPLLFVAALLPAAPARAAWTLQTNGTGQKAGYFQVSAADATHAMAVGTHDDGQGNQAAVLAVTSDGVSW